jgi:hypothetical protein
MIKSQFGKGKKEKNNPGYPNLLIHSILNYIGNFGFFPLLGEDFPKLTEFWKWLRYLV